jgi:monofunctional glycosyltransferase
MAFALGFAYVCYIYLTLPDVRPLATINPKTTAFMELRIREAEEQGRKLQIRQQWVPYSRIPNTLRRAVLVAEDSAFFDHEGVDYKQLRASLEANWEDGKFTRGASTITQQLAKNLYLSPSKNPIRKLKELLITRRLEAALSKRRILEIYLNVIEWGDGIFGCEAASRAYFAKSVSALTAEEAALLAGALINPREHSPARPTARLLRRQRIIFARMGVKPPAPVPISDPALPAVEPSPAMVDPVSASPLNSSPPQPPTSVHSVQPLSGNGGTSPVSPTNPKASSSKNAASEAPLLPRSPGKGEGEVRAIQDANSWLQQPAWSGGVNYTGQITRLMHDLVARVPALSFIDLDRILVFARPGRSSADGAYASCHSLGLPTSDPGYFYWRDKKSDAVTRRTEWFVTKSPDVLVDDLKMNYLISFSLPRFTDQTLSRSRKRDLYAAGTPDWIAKLDTVVHELYHIDPEQDCLRRFKRADGEYSDALHSPTFFEDVVVMVQEYLASRPDARLLEFLKYDFEGLRQRFGGVAGTTFRYFPSYPRRYREVTTPHAMPADIAAAPVEEFIDAVPAKLWSESDLQLREFLGNGSRLIETYTSEKAA